MVLTNAEAQVLNAIFDEAVVKSAEEDDGDPMFHEIEVDSVKSFADKSTQNDVYTTLADKGLIQCSGTEDLSGSEVLEYVCITPEGIEALKTANGMH